MIGFGLAILVLQVLPILISNLFNYKARGVMPRGLFYFTGHFSAAKIPAKNTGTIKLYFVHILKMPCFVPFFEHPSRKTLKNKPFFD